MKRIAYYISEYGYGHASRSIGIIRELIKQESELEIIVINSFAEDFLKQSLDSSRIIFRNVETDIGYFLKENSIYPDAKRQRLELDLYLSTLNHVAKKEVEYLKRRSINLVISDISPLAFKVGKMFKVPTIGISNFSWYTAFKELITQKQLLELESIYKYADYFFELAGSNELQWGKTFKFEFIARDINYGEVERIKQLYGKNKKLVFLGLGMKVDVEIFKNISIWDDVGVHFIVSSNSNINHDNVSTIPVDYTETQNFVAACDLVISKAGWGTVSEAAIGGVPLLIIEREKMSEDSNTIKMVRDYNLGLIIKWEEFIKQKNVDYVYHSVTSRRNDTPRIAEKIIGLM